MASALVARGHEVHVLSCVGGQKHKDYLHQGVHIHLRRKVRIRRLGRVNRILQVPGTIERLNIGLSTFFEYRRLGVDFDIIEYPDWGAEGWLFALLHTRPLIAELHTPLPLIHKYDKLPLSRDVTWGSFLEYFAVRRADVIISPSCNVVRALKEIGWLPKRNPYVVPHAIDWRRWRSTQPVLNTPPTVLFLGVLNQLKAPELLIEALSIIREKIPRAEALFAGSTDSLREGLPYLEWMKKSGFRFEGCRFLGHVRRHELIRLFSTSRILAVPSWFENYCLVALEAMASGRPIVVTSTNGVAELIEQAETGRVVPPGDSKALAEALFPFLMDAAYAARAGERARATVQEWSDPDKIAAQREAVYQQAIMSFKH